MAEKPGVKSRGRGKKCFGRGQGSSHVDITLKGKREKRKSRCVTPPACSKGPPGKVGAKKKKARPKGEKAGNGRSKGKSPLGTSEFPCQ